MFQFPPIGSQFAKDGDGRTTGGYTFHEDEHPRSRGGKFGENGGSKPYVKENGTVSEKSKERVKEYSHPDSEKADIEDYFHNLPTKEDEKQLEEYKSSDYDGNKLGTQEIQIADLKPAPEQKYIIREHLESLKEARWNPEVVKLPNGSYIVEDGHHRIVDAMIRGKKTMKVDVYGYPKEK